MTEAVDVAAILLSVLLVALATGAVVLYTQKSRRIVHTVKRASLTSAPNKFDGVTEALSGMDQLSMMYYVPVTLRFNSIIDAGIVRKGLSLVLDDYPVLSGRIDSSANIPCITQFDSGVEFEIVHSSRNDILSFKKAEDWMAAGVIKDKMTMMYPRRNQPLLYAKLTIFSKCNISILSVAFSHGVGDFQSMCDVVRRWSFHCGGKFPSGSKLNCYRPLSQPIGNRRHRISKEHIFGETPKEIARYRTNVDSALVHPYMFLKALPRLLWLFVTNEKIELRVDASRVDAWKKSIVERLPNGSWLSSYEVIMSCIYCAHAEAMGSAHKAKSASLLVNARGRTKAYESNYFGNAVVFRKFKLSPIPADLKPVTRIAKVAAEIHSFVRGSIAATEELERAASWIDCVQDVGYGSSLTVPMTPTIMDQAVVMNNWNGYGILDVDMGSGDPAVSFIANPMLSGPNTFMLAPRDRKTGDLTFIFFFPRSKILSLSKIIQQWGLPFQIVM